MNIFSRIIGAPFRWIENLLKAITPFRWLETGMPLKGKIIIAVLVLVSIAGAGYTSFRLYDFTQNNPNFCVSCHLMKTAFETWEASEHQEINCHECHQLSVEELNQLLISFVFRRPTEVPDRHGKIIVPWKNCIKCHWEEDEKFPDAKQINKSRMHAKHYFMEQVECSKCHGYDTHVFVPEARFCVRCHQGKVVHGEGMGQIACLNCHTDRTPDLRPGRAKCMYCHGDEKVREMVLAGGTLDATHYKPPDELVAQAIKIEFSPDSPMQFQCYTCHKPHESVRPNWGSCVECHRNVINVGKHGFHIQVVGMECKQCHKPHNWQVTEKSGKKDCVLCHEYRPPMQFLKG